MKPFSAVASLVFAVVAFLQLMRFVLGWSIVIEGVTIPLWASAIAFVAAAVLSYQVWREARR